MQAKSSFFVLQALDLATTLVAFHFGAFEVNPLVGRLTTLLGPTGGVLASKVVAVLIASGFIVIALWAHFVGGGRV